MRAFSLHKRFLLGTLLLVASLGASMAVFVHTSVRKMLMDELQQATVLMSLQLAREATSPVLTGDYLGLRLLFDEYQERHHEISYLFVVDADGAVAAQTFGDRFPAELLRANVISSGRGLQARSIELDGVALVDVAVPLLDGKAGTARVGVSAARIQQRVSRIVTILVAATAVLLLLVAFGTTTLVRRITRPLSEIAAAASAAGKGDPNVRVPVRGTDEMGQLAVAFNEMMAERQRTLAEQGLRVSRFASLGEIATGLAHQISNPVAAISGVLEIVRDDLRDRPRQAELVGDVLLECHKVGRVMKELLEFARPPKLRTAPLDLNAVVERALSLLASSQSTDASPAHIERVLGANLPQIQGDETQLTQAIVNVALNGVQAMEKSSRRVLRVQTCQRDGGVILQIEDTGTGIDPHVRDRIFDPYFTTRSTGTGLGLSHTARIVNEHGGKIEWEPGLHHGTIFRITFHRWEQER